MNVCKSKVIGCSGYVNLGRMTRMDWVKYLVGVSRMDRVRNKEVRRRDGIERELASRAEVSPDFSIAYIPAKCLSWLRTDRDGLGMWKNWTSTV